MTNLTKIDCAKSEAMKTFRAHLSISVKVRCYIRAGHFVAILSYPRICFSFAHLITFQGDGLDYVRSHLSLLDKRMSEIGEVSWNSNLEAYFVSSGEKAHGLAMLHKDAEALYSYRRTFIELPVIVGSALIGFLNAGSTSMFEDPKTSSVALGVGSLVVSILQTVNTYFNWSKRSEGHRLASIQYAKLYRFLSIEMSLPREERMTPSDLLKQVRDTYDRLQEVSPLIPAHVLVSFKKKADKYPDIARPEETNGLEKIVIYNPMLRNSSVLSTPKPEADSV